MVLFPTLFKEGEVNFKINLINADSIIHFHGDIFSKNSYYQKNVFTESSFKVFLTKNSSTNLIFTVLSLMLTFMNHHRQSRKSINIFYYVEFIIHLLIFFIFHLNLMIFIALRNFQIMRKTTSKKPQIAVLRNFINDLVLD